MALRLCARFSSGREGRNEKREAPRRPLKRSLRRCKTRAASRCAPRSRLFSSATNSSGLRSEEAPPLPEVTEEAEIVTEEGEENPPVSFWARVRNWFKVDTSRLQNLGIGAFLAYGFVSNVNYGVCFTIAWLTHVKRTGMIPFARGQWPAFLGVFAGLWALQNVLRPVRLAAAIALTPLVNHMLQSLVTKLGIERRQAVMLLLFGLAVFTLSSLVTGIWVLGGIPASPPKTV